MVKFYSQTILDQIKENYMVGILATKEDNLPRLGDDDEPVTYSQAMEDIIFFIKPLSEEPKEITKIQQHMTSTSNLYIGFGSKSLSDLSLEFKYNNDIPQKIKYIRESIEGKLLVFKPVLRQQEQKDRFHKNITDLFAEDIDWIEGTEYLAVPRINLTPEEFESKLFAEEAFNLYEYNHAMPAPLYILCGNYIYGNIKENQWRIDSSINNNNARIIISPNTVKKVKISEREIQENIGSDRENLVFFDDQFIQDSIASRLDEEGELLEAKDKEVIDNDYPKNNDTQFVQENNVVEDPSINKLNEIAFIKDLEKKAKERRLVYGKEDLINFHTSIKSSAFTILSGQSGIGKTKLATIYGETLGLSQNNKNMLIMSITPSYTEPGDILGYYNPTSGLYMPAETGLVDFLLNAEKYNEQVHMLIMDEMNLSQVEHYFSPFISLLELEEKERYLNLYSEGVVCHNNQKYKRRIQLRDNLVIVGTMNTDETTKDLSDRLLDRSNVVVLDKKSFLDIKRELEETNLNVISNTGTEDAYGELYLTWKSNKDSWKVFSEDELIFFDRLDGLISKVDPLKGFSIRNIIRMGAYLNNLPNDPTSAYQLDRGKAIDLFIKQRVITKLRGPIEMYEKIIGSITVDNNVCDGELYNILCEEEAANISGFKKTKIELIRKARELSLNGYAT